MCPKKNTSRVQLFGHDQVLIFEREKETMRAAATKKRETSVEEFNSLGTQLNKNGSKTFLRQVKVLPEIPPNRNE